MNTYTHPISTLKKVSPQLLRTCLKFQLRIIPKTILFHVMSKAFNDALKKPIASGDFDFLENRFLTIKINDIDFEWSMTLIERQIKVLSCPQSDSTLSGDSYSLMQIATQLIDADTLFFQRKLSIEGDTEFALEVKNTLDALDKSDLAPMYCASLNKIEKILKSLS